MKRVWKTKDGQRLKIREMETRHIKNCISLLERYNEARTEAFYMSGSFINGEQAGYAFDDACLDLEENGWDDWVDDYIYSFKAELTRRT